MNRTDFFYDLPPELIAQTPIEPRDASRLLCLDRQTGGLSHRIFSELPDLLRPGDLLVMNDSRVLPARLFGRRKDTGAEIELLLLEDKGGNRFETLVRPGKKAKPGVVLTFGEIAEVTILDVVDGGNRIVEFSVPAGETVYSLLDQIGQMPLPPYITRRLEDKERYQTVYARENGSAAAPTAGLHFTPQLLARLEERGIDHTFVTLHVGLGTFRPVKVDVVEEHHMHSEHYRMTQETAEKIRRTKAAGGRVIAVGTTSCRTLESVAAKYGEIRPDDDSTEIFIYPGYQFRAIDGLITNFHLPESTLIMLVSAFAGYDNTMAAYKKAVEEQYRFFSFGDAMLIV
ncbi:MAG: tRNA preQ1(34) S-adenosylmethionine ribosyltransferase-isomerase QueA [Oscillospiraceae bacterium]|nr:tRNA preQ1(34) S-adenosylmethionine ribosyltransferase-isomerase QueA [Oscillospiraceae bacterium]